jgi:DNA-directed RNA polymerase subunit RPC12/RpoP
MSKCSRYECLRKFKAHANDSISDFCGVVGKDEKNIIPNDPNCPLRCVRFWDYELKKEITKHEDVHWISTKKDDLYYHGLFAGISNEGLEVQEKRNAWEEKHENVGTIVCPYCDYEYDSCDCIYEDGEDVVECYNCGKEFNVITEVSYSWTTSKIERDEEK